MIKLVLLVAISLALTFPAQAKKMKMSIVTVCSPSGALTELLNTEYKERSIATGLTNEGFIIEVLTTESGDTWTMIIHKPNGDTCTVFAGEGWRHDHD